MFRQYYEEILNYLLKGTCWKGATDAERSVIQKRASKYKVINGVLYHKGKGRGIEDLRLVATTASDQQNAIRMCHISEVDNQHFGINKTASLLALRFYWRMMYTDVIKYVDACPKCQRVKVQVAPEPPPETEERPWVWRMLEVEVLDHFLVSGRKVYHLLRIVDVHSNWTTFTFLEDTTERTAVRMLFRECSVLGFPLAFRFIRKGDDSSWKNCFVSALHQELDGFSSASGQDVDTSVHVVMEEEEDNLDWQPERCLNSCQEIILDHPGALFVFFGNRSIVDQRVHDWYTDQVRQFIKKEPFWWTQRLSSFVFHLRNCLPPGMTDSPASVLASGSRGECRLFLPIPPETEEPEKVKPVVAQPAPKELLAQSCIRTGKMTKVVKPAAADVNENKIEKPNKETKDTPTTSEKLAGKRKPESESTKLNSGTSKASTSHSSSNKRLHQSAKPMPSSSILPSRTEEEQKKIDAGIMDALNRAISKGMKDVERQKKKKRHKKKNNDHTKPDMFDMTVPLVLPPTRSPALEMASSMSSLEALKAVTGTSLPQSVPPSPLLPSAILSPTTPGENSPAPPQEEASPGRYSFRQNLKPKGSSNFIKRLIAKTSSKRYTGVPAPTTELQLQWPPSPEKKSKRSLRTKHTSSHISSPSIPSALQTDSSGIAPVQIPPPVSSVQLLQGLTPAIHSPDKGLTQSPFTTTSTTPSFLEQSSTPNETNSSPSHLKRTDSTALDEDFEPHCNIALTRAEEELIDQTIKGVDENGFIDTDKMVGDDVLAVEDISKVDLSGMDVSETSTVSVPSTSAVNASLDAIETLCKNDIPSSESLTVGGASEHTATNGDVPDSSEVVEQDILRPEEGSSEDPSKISKYHTDVSYQGNSFTPEQSNSTEFLNNMEIKTDDSATAGIENERTVELNEGLESGNLVLESADTNEPSEDIEMHVLDEQDETHSSVDIGVSETCTVEVNSDVIFDVLDTCATFEVGEKPPLVVEISESMEDNELELVKDKISQDLASGLTVDKTRTAKANEQMDVDTADTDEYSIMASACDALLHMAAATPVVSDVNNATTLSTKEAEAVNVEVSKPQVVANVIEETQEPTVIQTSVVEELAADVPAAGAANKVVEYVPVEDGPLETENVKEEQVEKVSLLEVPVEETSANGSVVVAVEDESELCLPSDFFIDEEVLKENSTPVSKEESAVDKTHGQAKLVADQDIVTILNSIMSNRAFLEDPVARAQRVKEDKHYKALYGLKREIRIKVKAIAELVVQRAILGPVPVRTIRNNDRRAYYVGNVKIFEFKVPFVPKASPPGAPPKNSVFGVKKARVLLPKVPPASKMQAKLHPALSMELNKTECGESGRSTPLGIHSLGEIKKGKKGFGCPICPRTYVISQEMLDLHIAFHIDNARNLHCPVCGKAGTVWTNILKHYLGHPEIKENASLYEMILATCDKDRTHCGQCNTLFALRNALINHLQSSHIGEKVNGNTKLHLVGEIHTKEPFAETPPNTKAVSEVKDVNYLCPNCPYSTKTHYNLILHNHECQGNVQKFGDSFTKILDDLTPQFKCSHCVFCGVSSKQLEQHIRLHHSNNSSSNNNNNNSTTNRGTPKPAECKYACEFCPMKFRTADLLRLHAMKHKEESMFHCKACNYKCRYKKIMHRHAHKMHPDMPLKGLIQAPKKLKTFISSFPSEEYKLKSKDNVVCDEPMKESEEQEEEDEGIPTATVVVHTDENGELTVCDEEDVSSIPLQAEQTTYLLDSSTLDSSTVALDGSAVTLDSTAVTLDGNVLQILQGETGDYGRQQKVLFLSVDPSELESLNASTFAITEQNSSS